MARRRARSGETEWIGITDTTTIGPTETAASITLARCEDPGLDYSGAPENLPEGTLLRIMGTIGVSTTPPTGSAGSSIPDFQHHILGIHYDEGMYDSNANALDSEIVNVSQSADLGFEGILWMGDIITWSFSEFGDGGERVSFDAKLMNSTRVDSKSKRVIHWNDLLRLDVAQIGNEGTATYDYNLRLLIKRA